MPDKLFEISLKLCTFEAITDRLLDNRVITHGEAAHIRKALSQMRDNQVKGDIKVSHARDNKAA